VEPETLDNITLVFTDIARFDTICGKSTPVQIVAFLNDIYSQIDDIVDEYDCFKIQLVNDCYVLCTGINTGKDDARLRMFRLHSYR
jgi:hypothetical protein